MSAGSVELQVRAAEKRDAGRGIARLPEAARSALGVLSGDAVLITGSAAAVAKCWPARPGSGPETIRIDADTRENVGVGVGDRVRVSPADGLPEAEAVRIRLATPVDLPFGVVAAAARDALRDRPIGPDQTVRLESIDARFRVAETTPGGNVVVTDDTEIRVEAGDETPDERAEPADDGARGVTYEDIGGLDEELELVRELVELPLAEPELFARLGVEPPKGVLLHGPPGTGKTLIARAVANEVDAAFHTVSGPEVVSKYKGDSEENLRAVFERAREDAPAVVFFDEIDSIAGERDDDGDMENRLVGQLLSLMDGLEARGDVVVIGATNRIDTLDPALRRGGRFDREVEIGAPNEAGRREILDVHTRGVPLADDVSLDALAARTHGFVGADLASLVTEAAMTALRRVRREDSGDTPVEELSVTPADVEAALADVDPSAMREYVAEQPTEGFGSVGGLDEPKATLSRAVEWPLRYGPLFEAADAMPPTGILLHGPPGTGKTLLARAAAAESGVNLVTVAGPELLDRYVGESEKAVREVFERARQAAPSVVLLDEVDAVARNRSAATGSEVGERVVSQLLTELDRAEDNPSIAVVATTNRKAALDPALLRPGRLESHVEVPAPGEDTRRAILAVHTAEKPLSDDVDLEGLAAETTGYSGADLEALCREAAMRAVRAVTEAYEGEAANEHADEVTLRPEHFDVALDAVEPSL